MANKVNYEELAKYAAEGVARALSGRGGASGGSQGKAQEHALNLPPRLIFGGDLGGDQFLVTFKQQGGTVQVGEITKAQQQV